MGQGEIVIDCPAERVFDAVADETAPYDPRIVHAEKLTPGPIGIGTRYRSEARGRLGTVRDDRRADGIRPTSLR